MWKLMAERLLDSVLCLYHGCPLHCWSFPLWQLGPLLRQCSVAWPLQQHLLLLSQSASPSRDGRLGPASADWRLLAAWTQKVCAHRLCRPRSWRTDEWHSWHCSPHCLGMLSVGKMVMQRWTKDGQNKEYGLLHLMINTRGWKANSKISLDNQ